MKAVIHKTGAIGEVLGIERRNGTDYVYFESGLSLPVSEVGFLTPYEQYVGDCYDWSDFRREAAKDILANMLSCPNTMIVGDKAIESVGDHVSCAIELADELIKQLKEGKK